MIVFQVKVACDAKFVKRITRDLTGLPVYHFCPLGTLAAPFTDYSRWRLLVKESKNWPQNSVDKYWLGLDLNYPALPQPKDAFSAAQNGYHFYKTLQADDGHWPGEYGGPMFILPGLVIGSYIEERLEMIRYLMNRANPQDGGWGIHVEGHSTVFGTALNYTVLRILGMDARSSRTLHKLGGATAIPSWGKFWLSLLNVYDWAGNNPIPPELWLLPEWVPFHPHRWWIQTRNIYIPMSYLYGVRFKMAENDMILALREELYPENYYSIDWPAQRNHISQADFAYESCALPPLRRRALARAYELIVFEDENTGYQTIAPVSKMFNLVARVYCEGTESEAFRLHKDKRDDFMWMGADGMVLSGTNGTQLWDIAFITQALVETGLADLPENKESLIRALEWLEDAQVLENPKHYEVAYRHATKGAWGFSTKEQGYTVTDCTGEGLKSFSDRRLYDAVDLLLSLQNPNGGFASYELVRGPSWLEHFSPAEVFGDIMVEYCYPECTTSVITSLSIFRKHYPDYRAADIQHTIKTAVVYLHGCQHPDGGWFGSWGICFTYGTQFALESLALVGETYATSKASRKACDFLLSKQRKDGGWGESYKSCELGKWVDHADTQLVQTCWGRNGAHNGSWPQDSQIEGIFNKNFSFTIWMLGKAHKYLRI
ncbi:terpene cyclase/mutase family member [Favolaschia claudopus]|uniref:Terpene cyclase/mutase family member n=1 Tax=Favolaschia claudopus TaxID=2862362 RepID=A0AAW0BVT7_9AGAR